MKLPTNARVIIQEVGSGGRFFPEIGFRFAGRSWVASPGDGSTCRRIAADSLGIQIGQRLSLFPSLFIQAWKFSGHVEIETHGTGDAPLFVPAIYFISDTRRWSIRPGNAKTLRSGKAWKTKPGAMNAGYALMSALKIDANKREGF